MSVRLSAIEDQVIVITGASSGIGLATARLAADRGARLVLVARNGPALDEVVRDIRSDGGKAIAVVGDVAHAKDMERAADAAIAAFGDIDSWVNNAGVSVYGTVDEISLADHRRVFDVNYWGVVHGSLEAARRLRKHGGAIVNVGSVLSDRAELLQGPYSASKHAVKAFTDTLRMELEGTGAPISVTLIKPSAMDTPFFEHAKTLLDAPGIRNPPPAYDPHLAARAILHACETPVRTLVVGFGGYAIALMGAHAPRLTDWVMEATQFEMQKSERPAAPGRRDNLYAPRSDGAVMSSMPGGSRRTSLFLEAQMRPVATATLLVGLGIGLAAALAGRSRPRPAPPSRRAEHDRLARHEGLARGDGEVARDLSGPSRSLRW